MAKLHHVHLGVPAGSADVEAQFLVDFLGFHEIGLTPGVPASSRWFESDQGSQIHLSEDPDFLPAQEAHVAVDMGAGLAELERKLDQAGIAFDAMDRPTRRTLFCRDQAGNRWELRGQLPA